MSPGPSHLGFPERAHLGVCILTPVPARHGSLRSHGPKHRCQEGGPGLSEPSTPTRVLAALGLLPLVECDKVTVEELGPLKGVI